MDLQKALIAEYDRETRHRKILEAIPEDVDFNYKPHQIDELAVGRPFGRDAAMATSTLAKDKIEMVAERSLSHMYLRARLRFWRSSTRTRRRPRHFWQVCAGAVG